MRPSLLRHWFYGLTAIWIGFFSASLTIASEPFGLGPLEIRDQFPLTLPFLSMAPDHPKTQDSGTWYFGYQLALSNTFLNSEGGSERSPVAGRAKDSTGKITHEEVKRGLTEGDFFDSKTGYPIPGFRNYMDVESDRQVLKIRYGFWKSLELGVELPFVSFSGGFMDSSIEAFHEMVGISNDTEAGAYRSRSRQNRYDYYVVKDGSFVIAEDRPFSSTASDPVIHIKWNLTQGGSVLPAVSVKLAYKVAAAHRSDHQKLISSGEADTGSYLLLSKGFSPWFVYFGMGNTRFGKDDTNLFSSGLQHRFIALEYQFNSNQALVIQSVTQSSMYPVSGSLRGTQEQTSSYFLSRNTELAVVGYKHRWSATRLETGFVEDYNQTSNQTDIVLYSEIGYQW